MDYMQRLQGSFSQVFGQLLPALLSALIMLFAGYLLAKVIERLVLRFLRRIRLNTMLERGGVMDAVERTGSRVDATRVVAALIFWLIMFAVILFAASVLGLEELTNVFEELVGYIPSVIAAVVILLLGIVLGGFVGGLIATSAGAVHGGTALSRIGRAGVIVLSVFMALQVLGIATEIVTTAFAILFGAIALAGALAFGLGNRELAAEITREWYDRYRAEREAHERATASAHLADALDDEDPAITDERPTEKRR
ncbi:MAG: hypothetical protein HOQ09_06510 [Gemmatimonadaceae bacterium]|nr:hypothetical protein [Gemmatimonadaceae bacterium]